MNQNVQIDLAAVMPAVRATGLLRSLCTIQTPPESDTFDAGGAMDPDTPWDDLTGHVDLPCMAAPLQQGDTVSPDETRSMAEILARTPKHVLLDGYYPELDGKTEYRAVVDGVAYNITKAESDSQAQMTRLAVELVTI